MLSNVYRSFLLVCTLALLVVAICLPLEVGLSGMDALGWLIVAIAITGGLVVGFYAIFFAGD